MFDKKSYMKEYNKKYRNEHKQELQKYHKEYKKKHYGEYYQKNKEKMLEYSKKWKKDNPEKHNEYNKKWAKNNPEKIKEMQKKWQEKNSEYQWQRDNSEYNKKWRKDNPEYHKQYMKYRRKADLRCNINHKISGQIWKSLRRNKNGWHWEDLVGYKLVDLIKHLKSTMPKSYTWKDYLEGKLHIDHIIPKSVFNFTKPEHIDFKRCWALKNLRLLTAKENNFKRAKIAKPFQPALKI